MGRVGFIWSLLVPVEQGEELNVVWNEFLYNVIKALTLWQSTFYF
jgi:hypothetical protein